MNDKKASVIILIRQIKAMVNETSEAISREAGSINAMGVNEVKVEALMLIKRLEPLLDEVKNLSRED